ncbi:TEA domain-containing protein [Mycena venus]|uniref:TEA domain-containing protein n=1 Tax=Mycena venus TaxID=2733690 RepID=A0A8H6XKX8_9AGAR|nr:TEA domain-containing protein [Mycena venus]
MFTVSDMGSNRCYNIPDDNSGSSSPLHTPLEFMQETRKIRRTSEDGGAIWPHHLESALLEGLQQFRPTVCRETVMLGRYPGRNQFISLYILTKTGQRRTAKQVASRLQQLRESCSEQELQDLFYPSPYSNPSQGEGNVPTRRLLVVIDIIPEDYPVQPYESSPQPWLERENVIHISHYPRRLSSVDPTATFTSPSPILAQSRFAVCIDKVTVHIENVTLLTVYEDLQLSHPQCFFYSTRLVPSYWKIIVESPDPTCYTIFHQVVSTEDWTVLFSATYIFRYETDYPTGGDLGQHTLSMGEFESLLDVVGGAWQ